MENSSRPSLLGLGLSIAVGLIASSAIVSYTLDRMASNKQSITVKGLAEKSVRADQARWRIVVHGHAPVLADAFAALRANQPKLRSFFVEQGFKPEQVTPGRETYQPVHKVDQDGRELREIESYTASQELLLTSSDVAAVDKAAGRIVSLEESGVPISVQNPEYLVSGLEQVKMSLIASATRNARERASEFAKTGDAQVGAMKSANQGAFYILPAQGGGSDDEYGGAYDKTTIDKLARVVVTVEYGISQ
ncbi:SIMPL domain-containing protein [Chitinimonas lacunae]|uniref:SIMPL domain-containing protein n=1 Tax=Chitinimonas lacunae TaxID=1963018 RepID=A0ABV8MKF5_9NEIS